MPITSSKLFVIYPDLTPVYQPDPVDDQQRVYPEDIFEQEALESDFAGCGDGLVLQSSSMPLQPLEIGL